MRHEDADDAEYLSLVLSAVYGFKITFRPLAEEAPSDVAKPPAAQSDLLVRLGYEHAWKEDTS